MQQNMKKEMQINPRSELFALQPMDGFSSVPAEHIDLAYNMERVLNHWIQALFANYDENMKKYLGFGGDKNAPIEEQAKQEFRRLLEKQRDKRHKYYYIVDCDNDNIGGIIKGIAYIYELDLKWERCALGIGILPEYRRKGLAQEVVLKMVKALFDEGIVRVECSVECDNRQSKRLFDLLTNSCDYGYYEGIRHNAWGPGIDAHIYSFTNTK